MRPTSSPLRRGLHALTLLAAVQAGCTGDDSLEAPGGDPSIPAADEIPVVEGCELRATSVIRDGRIYQGDMAVGRAEDMDRLCAEEAEVGLFGVGTNQASKKWPGGVVPFRISSDYPDPARVMNAIHEWEEHTDISFVDYDPDLHTNWVAIVNDTWCNADVGKQGGRQEVRLSTGKPAQDVRGIAIGPGDDVYTWYADGMMTRGNSGRLDAYAAQTRYAFPPGYDVGDLIETAFAGDGRLYAWYTDGKVSVGTPTDLDAHEPPHGNYTVLAGRSRAMIVGIAIGADDKVFTWYSDGTWSVGTSQNLALLTNPLAPGFFAGPFAPSTIRGMDISAAGKVYTFAGTGSSLARSIGTGTQLAADDGAQTTDLPVNCGQSAVMHELGHTLGLRHEQSRCDRDQHVNVYLANVEPGKESNFDKYCNYHTDYTSYDPLSIMHYSSGGFSKNDSPTLLRHGVLGGDLTGPAPIDMAIASDDHVYTWWDDGTVTAGTSYNLEYHRSRAPFTLAPGRTVGDLAGVAIQRDNDHVYAYYKDGTVSVGTSTNLDAYQAPYDYDLPYKGFGVNYQPSDIKAVGIAGDDHVYVWFHDGKVAAGTSDDLGAYRSPSSYNAESGFTKSAIVGIDIGPEDTVYTWYASGDASKGSSTMLGSIGDAYAIRGRGIWVNPTTELSAGDIEAIEDMY